MQIEIPPISTIFGPLPDWRKAKGKRYTLASLHLFMILAILCGKKSVRGMSRWGQALPSASRKRLGFHPERHPSAAMLCRVLWYTRVETLEENLAAWTYQVHQQLVAAGVSQGIAIDGKSIRRAASLGSKDAFVVSAVCHQLRFVLQQLAVADKTNEITVVPALLESLLLKGMVLTVDALLTQRSLAAAIRRRGGEYLMYVKENQPKLYWAIQTLFDQPHKPGLPPFSTARVVNKGHGRVEVREMVTSTALNDFLDWPGVQQVFRLTRCRHRLKDGHHSQTVVYGVTSLPPQAASPQQLIAITRDHWAAIENGIHWVRDVVMGEDLSQVHQATAPQAFAALRNLAITLSRLAGFDSVSAALDSFSAHPAKALSFLGL